MVFLPSGVSRVALGLKGLLAGFCAVMADCSLGRMKSRIVPEGRRRANGWRIRVADRAIVLWREGPGIAIAGLLEHRPGVVRPLQVGTALGPRRRRRRALPGGGGF